MQADSVLVQLLPFLDQGPLAKSLHPVWMKSLAEPPQSEDNAQALTTPVAVFECPSDSLPPGGTSYRTNYGSTTGIHATWVRGKPLTRPTSEEGLWGGFRDARHSGQITDGASNSAFFSERLVGDGNPAVYTPSRDVKRTGGHSYRPADAVANCKLINSDMPHASYLGWTWLPQGYAHTAYNHVLTPNSRIPDGFDTWNAYTMGQGAMTARSFHSGGANVAFGDASVRLVSEGIDLKVWRALGTNNGNEVVGAF